MGGANAYQTLTGGLHQQGEYIIIFVVSLKLLNLLLLFVGFLNFNSQQLKLTHLIVLLLCTALCLSKRFYLQLLVSVQII